MATVSIGKVSGARVVIDQCLVLLPGGASGKEAGKAPAAGGEGGWEAEPFVAVTASSVVVELDERYRPQRLSGPMREAMQRARGMRVHASEVPH